MGGLDSLLTTEMDGEQWSAFRLAWIKDWTQGLVTECGLDADHASEQAGIDFERCVGQEGFTARNERISTARGGW